MAPLATHNPALLTFRGREKTFKLKKPVGSRRGSAGMREMLLVLFATGGAWAMPLTQPASHQIANSAITLMIEKQGAIITELRLARQGENWLALAEQMGDAHRFGHFLCFDRWGPVSAAEAAAGMPFHGAAGIISWDWVKRLKHETLQRVQLPVSRLLAKRSVALVDDAGVFVIQNNFENPTRTLLPYNAVEHTLFSRRWLGDETRLSTNARRGFLTFRGEPIPDSEFEWPMARYGGREWDLRGKVAIGDSTVASMVFPDGVEWAWVCLENQLTHEVFGFVWRTRDYPWLDLWWSAVDGVMLNRSIEPGTTGLHQPMPVLEKTRTYLGRPVLCTLAPGEKRTHRVWGFALGLPADGGSVRRVIADGETLKLERETGAPVVLPMSGSGGEN